MFIQGSETVYKNMKYFNEKLINLTKTVWLIVQMKIT